MEYRKYVGAETGYVQREDASEEWVECSTAEAQLAEETLLQERLEGRRRVETGRVNTVVIRSDLTERIAARLGLTADELAESLALPDQNQGTRRRIPDEEFDGLMAELQLDPKDARDRFAGRYWTRAEGPTTKMPVSRLRRSEARERELEQPTG